MAFENYEPPQNFEPAGDVTITPPAELPFDVDTVPTEGSSNAITSGAVFVGLANKEGKIVPPSVDPEKYVLNGRKEWANLTTLVTDIVADMDLGMGGGGGEEPPTYVTQANLDAEFGVQLTGALNLTPVTATRYASYSQTIARSVFSMTGGNASLTLVSAPAGCVVVIGETNVTIAWVPVMSGEHYVVFWLSNAKKLGRPASLKITVAAGETITPIGDLVLTTASIAAGMLVNIYNDAGTKKMRPALATAVGTIAVAFVTQNAAAGGQLVPKYSGNVNPYFTGLTPGKRYFLSTTTPGGISEFGPAASSGHVWQPVGRAISSTELLLDIDEHIIRSSGS